MPFAVSERDGVLTLTLDTPGSPVNVLNHDTARQLVDVLAGVTPARTRAVVFDSAKPNSFLNGVGLLLAQASRTLDDVYRASELPWRAYRAVVELPVPTVAVVQGTCFGCGVEFALSCDYRIATDSGETCFYMTELHDYLFIPLFGSTWNLPEAVGLADAIDLLLWGARWGASRAAARGLVDETVPFAQREEATRRFVERVAARRQRSRKRGPVAWGAGEDEVVAASRRRIAELPPDHRPVYGDALDLLCTGARRCGTYVEHQRRELERSAASALAPVGKAAYAFFYLRQMAAERAAGRIRGADEPASLRLDIDPRSTACGFAAALRARVFPGARLVDSGPADVRLVSAGASRGDGGDAAAEAAVRVELAHRPASPLEIYAPTHAGGGRLVELAGPAPAKARGDGDPIARLARTLQRFGFEVARTAPGATFLTTRLLTAFLLPLVRAVEDGVGPQAVVAALRDAGFARTPGDVLAGIAREPVAAEIGRALGRDAADRAIAGAIARLADARPAGDRGEPAVLDALCLSLLEAADEARASGAVADATAIDLVARELLDFPRRAVSMCTWLKRERVARALDATRDRAWSTPSALAAATAFAAGGREFYR
jgi:enoyl-CoA hydratase/carnithine racemase